MRTSARLALTLSLLVGGTSAIAEPTSGTEVVTKVVRFKDLNLATGEGAQTLYERIAGAARVVCHGAPQFDVRACRSRAIDAAVRTIGNPLLSSVHRSVSDGVEEVVLR
jgi:UrcA family protein